MAITSDGRLWTTAHVMPLTSPTGSREALQRIESVTLDSWKRPKGASDDEEAT